MDNMENKNSQAPNPLLVIDLSFLRTMKRKRQPLPTQQTEQQEKLDYDLLSKRRIHNAYSNLWPNLEGEQTGTTGRGSSQTVSATAAEDINDPHTLDSIPYNKVRLQAGFNLCTKLTENGNALLKAAKNGQEDRVKHLLGLPDVDPSLQDDVVLWEAMKHEQTGVVEILLEDPRVAAKDDLVITDGVILAISRGNIQLTQILLEKRAEKIPVSLQRFLRRVVLQFYTPLEDAPSPTEVEELIRDMLQDNFGSELIVLLVTRMTDTKALNDTIRLCQIHLPAYSFDLALHHACAHGNQQAIGALLCESPVDPGCFNNRAIRLAAANGHVGTVNRLLKDPRVDPSSIDPDALVRASYNGHENVVNSLPVDQRVSPESQDNLVIQCVALKGHFEALMKLSSDNVDARDRAFDMAVRNGHERIVSFLNSFCPTPPADMK